MPEIPAPSRRDAAVATVLATPAALALHNNFRTSVHTLRRSLVRSLHYLVAIQDRKVHRALGYATITDYTAAVAGFTRNQTEVFLTLGRRLGAFPEVRVALERGEISWSRALEIVTQVAPADVDLWINTAGTPGGAALTAQAGLATPKLTRQSSPVVRAASGPEPAEPAVMPPPPAPADSKCHVSFGLSPEEYIEWGARLEALRKQGRDEDSAQLMLAAYAALAERGAANRVGAGPHYHLLISLCPECGAGELRNARGRFEAPPALLEAARCDAIRQEEDGARRAVVPSRVRRAVLARDGYRCQAPGCANTRYLEIHHRIPAAAGGMPEPANLVTLCSRCHRALHQRERDLRETARQPQITSPPLTDPESHRI